MLFIYRASELLIKILTQLTMKKMAMISFIRFLFCIRKKIFVFLLFGIFPFFSQSKEIINIETGHIHLVFYDPGDQTPYLFNPEEWPEEAKQGIIEAFSIVHDVLDTKRMMTIGLIWSEDVEDFNSIALSYNSFEAVPDMGDVGVGHLDKNYKYPRELFNQLLEGDFYSGENIVIIYNSTKDWCYNKSNTPTSDQQDLITVTLHEVVHGLGMSSGFTKENEGPPYIFDKYITDVNSREILEYYPEGEQRENALTNDQVYFVGPNTMKANNNQPIQLYAPSSLTSASLCHVDNQYRDNPGADLMVPGTDYGQNTRYLGSYIIGILADVGWQIKQDPNPSPNQTTESQDKIHISSSGGTIFIENKTGRKIEVFIYTASGIIIKRSVQDEYGSYQIPVGIVCFVTINGKTYKIRTS